MKPLVPADVDLRDFTFMPFDVQRLLTSETWVLGTGDERAAAITLWLVSWHQVPAASLPNNERMLAHLSQAKSWARVREHAMRGWTLCDDGRRYHPVVAEKALEAWLEKLAQRLSSGAGNAKRWGVEFDPAPIESAMLDARTLLMELNPQSRTLSKRRTSGVLSGSKKGANGNPKSTPSGVPSGSQETGTGTYQEQELPTDSARATSAPADDLPPEPTPAGLACLLMRKAGCSRVNPSHPNLLAALAEGVTPKALADTASEGVTAGKGDPFTWAIKTARNRHAAGAEAVTGESYGNHSAGGSIRHESTAERAARFAREGDERDAARAAASGSSHGDAQVLAAYGGDLRPPLDVGLRRAL